MQHRQVMPRLSVMMFLQFFVWGAWYVTVGNYMRAHGMAGAIGWAYSVGPIAAMVSPIFLGTVADRYFASERVLGVLHILGGVVMFAAPLFGEPENPSSLCFILVLLVHMLCYMPTLGLTNTLAFHNLTNQEKQFPLVRVFGTIGWIVAGIVVSTLLAGDRNKIQFFVTGGAAIVLGLYSFTLPHTPPPAAGQAASLRKILGFDSWAMMRQGSFAVFIIASFLICLPLAAYYVLGPVFIEDAEMGIFVSTDGAEKPATYMLFGQVAEIVFMLVMPLCFARLGVKWMLLVGMFAWVLRYALFAVGAPDSVVWMIMFGILLHGICYDFFFVTGFIYVDRKASPDVRGQAQGFLVFVTQGLGMLIGAQIAQRLFSRVVIDEGALALEQWRQFWVVPCIAAGVILVVFARFFHEREHVEGEKHLHASEK